MFRPKSKYLFSFRIWLLLFLVNWTNAGLLNNINLGLTIPAMEVSVPAPALPNVKLKTVILKPPKQSLKSLLPRFSYNVPTFNEDVYGHHNHHLAYSASNKNPTILKSPAQLQNKHKISARPTQSSMSSQSHTLTYRPETQVQFHQPSKERQHPHQQNTVHLGQYAKLQSPYTTVDELQQRYGYGLTEKNINAFASTITSTGPIGRTPYRLFKTA